MDYWEPKPIVIVTDRVHFDGAIALRAGLEFFCLRVCLFLCGLEKNIRDALSGQLPDCDHVILFGGGDRGKIRFYVYPEIQIGPKDVVCMVRLPGKLVMTVGCTTGVPAMANVFLASGCRAFIGPNGSVDQEIALLFPLMFYRYLLQHIESDKPRLSERQAFEAARACVPEGDVFEMHERADRSEAVS